jgi:hypothetical protein
MSPAVSDVMERISGLCPPMLEAIAESTSTSPRFDPVADAAAFVDDAAETFKAKVSAGELGPSGAVGDGDPLASSGSRAGFASGSGVGLVGEPADAHDRVSSRSADCSHSWSASTLIL